MIGEHIPSYLPVWAVYWIHGSDLGRVYTALERGIHSPEWIVKSLKAGRNSKKGPHDVYCSRCGHLTAFQDLSGEEGGMSDIAHATVRSLAPNRSQARWYKEES